MNSYNYDGKNTPRQELIHAAVLAIHPAAVANDQYVWNKLDEAASHMRHTRNASAEYYFAIESGSRAAIRLLNDVRRAVREYYAE